MEEATETEMAAMFEEIAAHNPAVVTIEIVPVAVTIEIVVPIGAIVQMPVVVAIAIAEAVVVAVPIAEAVVAVSVAEAIMVPVPAAIVRTVGLVVKVSRSALARSHGGEVARSAPRAEVT